MLRAVGLGDKELGQPFVGVSNLASDVTPCNVHLNRVVQAVRRGIGEAGGTPFEFGTLTVSDAVSMGTQGMKASLVSREVIADSIELVSFAERFDGLVTVAGCDKNMPGTMMAAARLNIPCIHVYGGTIMPGRHRGRDINIQDVFEAVGAYSKGSISGEELREVECAACPGAGSCAGLFTANTMSSAIEALGMSLPGDASIPAEDPPKGRGGGGGGAGSPESDGEGDSAPGHNDEGGLRECDNAGDGDGWVHKRCLASAGHCSGSAGVAVNRRFR